MTSRHWSPALGHALAAARAGYHVFPLSRTKLPAVRSPHRDQPGLRCRGECGRIGHGVHDATTDPDQLTELFNAAPWATGYGIACGRSPHHLIGIDLDRKNGLDGVTAFTQLAATSGFDTPNTVTVTTPSGGLHLWLSGPDGVPVANSASQLAPGIDVRGSGGYLVGPGSVGAKGAYGFHPRTRRQVQPVPGPLLALLTTPKRQPAPAARPDAAAARGGSVARLVRFVLESPTGQTNNRLFWAACRAFERPSEQDPNTIGRALLEAALAKGHPEAQALSTITSAHRTVRGAA